MGHQTRERAWNEIERRIESSRQPRAGGIGERTGSSDIRASLVLSCETHSLQIDDDLRRHATEIKSLRQSGPIERLERDSHRWQCRLRLRNLKRAQCDPKRIVSFLQVLVVYRLTL